jgi:hypothetical protein
VSTTVVKLGTSITAEDDGTLRTDVLARINAHPSTICSPGPGAPLAAVREVGSHGRCRLPEAGPALRRLAGALGADGWREREEALCVAAELLLDVQRRAGLPTDPRRPAVEPFHDRPFRGIAPHVEEVLPAAVADPPVQSLPRGVGSVEQWSDNVRVLTTPALRRRPLQPEQPHPA